MPEAWFGIQCFASGIDHSGTDTEIGRPSWDQPPPVVGGHQTVTRRIVMNAFDILCGCDVKSSRAHRNLFSSIHVGKEKLSPIDCRNSQRKPTTQSESLPNLAISKCCNLHHADAAESYTLANLIPSFLS
jgi:hypothetical protein